MKKKLNESNNNVNERIYRKMKEENNINNNQ